MQHWEGRFANVPFKEVLTDITPIIFFAFNIAHTLLTLAFVFPTIHLQQAPLNLPT